MVLPTRTLSLYYNYSVLITVKCSVDTSKGVTIAIAIQLISAFNIMKFPDDISFESYFSYTLHGHAVYQ